MADRRMFSKSIIDSDAFIEMPMTTQCLYFHLGMRADDDGVVNNAKSIMRLIGAKEDDMNVLIARKFVICLDQSIIVIKHWKINNYIQKDRYKPSKYQELINSLEIEENGAYTSKIKENKDEKCIQSVSTSDTQYRLGKVRLDTNNNILSISDDEKAVFDLWNKLNFVKHRELTEQILSQIRKSLAMYGKNKIFEAMLNYSKVYHDESYFFKYKWSLIEFLKQANAMPEFFNDGVKYLNYCNRKTNKSVKEPDSWVDERISNVESDFKEL